MSHLYPSYNRSELAFEKGEGPWLWDKNGRRYFDFGSGIGVTALGHGNKKLASVIAEQAGKLMQVSNLYTIPEQEELADAICEASFGDYVFFTNSGAEACEAAFKTARRYHYDRGEPRHEIISIKGCFHGRTLAGIASAGSPKMVDGFGPMPEGFKQIELDEKAITEAMNEKTAAIIVEPVIGEGGIRVVSNALLRHMRSEADRVGALVIFDEIQCGMGRTGKLFAYEHSGVEPDIMCLAKGLGGGFPIGACVANNRTGKVMIAGTHGSTYGGNPLACRVGKEVITIMQQEGFLVHVNRLAGHASQRLGAIVDTYPEIFEELRGEGLMLGLKTKIENLNFVQKGRESGVLTVPAAENVIRLLPPLNMTLEELDAGLDLIEATAKELSS